MDLDKVLLIDKPAGITSFGVVARIRRQISDKKGKEQPERRIHSAPGAMRKTVGLSHERKRIKVGHTGTLDPFATGLMIILTGKETKNADKYSKLDKVYEAVIEFGKASTTGDPEGEISDTNLAIIPTLQEVNKALESFVGEVTQVPPIYSAIKVNGQRAYKLAHKGKEVKIPPRKVNIYRLELLDFKYPFLKIQTHVSSGTYIRTLAEDIGKKLGTGAYTKELRRLKVGEFDIKDAVKLPLK